MAGWFRDKAIRAEEAAKKAAQENLDAVEGMEKDEKGALWTGIAIAIVIGVILGAIFI
jgi:ElaB/YqjD/DUF883 family membrane-anchored ribosome-binding protein